MVAGYGLVDWRLRETQARVRANAKAPPPATWPSNSVVSPGALTGITLEAPDNVAGANLMTNANFTNWVAEKKWAVKLQFEPRPVTPVEPATNVPVLKGVKPETGPTKPGDGGYSAPVAVVVLPGQADYSLWWLPVACVVGLLVVGGKWLIERLNQQVQDSADFRDALARWSGRISREHQTPRSAKRLVNKLRFYAMMMRALRATGTSPQVPENALVAFGVLDAEGKFTNGEVELSLPAQLGMQLDRQPRSMDDDISALQEAMAAQPDVFRYLQSAVVDGSASKPASQS